MKKHMINLNDYKKNKYSQYGEDGILEKIFIELGISRGVFCEFGAWDGIYLSNTYALCEKGWSAIYIEGDQKKFNDLTRNITTPNAFLICDYVQVDGERSLDNILVRAGDILKDGSLDLLSIDIDSDDLSVFQSLNTYRPTVVVIEYNPTIPLDVEYINPQGENKGNSARSIVKYAFLKNYALVAVTKTNLIFIASEKKPENMQTFDLNDIELFPIRRYFWGYDGALMVSYNSVVETQEIINIPWASVFFPQPIPKFLRKFNQSLFLKSINFALSLLKGFLFSPVELIKKIINKLRSS